MKIKRLIIFLLTVSVVAFSFTFGLNTLNTIEDKRYAGVSYQGIINLWHIDSFEGGVGSRADFLFKETVAFEKQNKGVLILVTNHTIESYNENISNGVYPDFISYGVGVDVVGVKEMTVKDNFIGGKLLGKTFAVCWCRGGYVLIENPSVSSSNGVVVSFNGNTKPYTAIALSEKQLKIDGVKSPLDAYYDFVTGKSKYLLGTQRDINRLIKRDFSANLTPITAFNDLYQYISVITDDQNKTYYINAFIERLLSVEVQKKLKNIGMLSVSGVVEYADEGLALMEETKGFSYTVSGFSDSVKNTQIESLSKQIVENNLGDKEKLKNMLLPLE